MVWTRAGDLDPKAWSLRGPRTVTPVATQIAVAGVQSWDPHFHTGLAVPPNTPPGAYTLYRGEASTGVTVTVTAPAARRRVTRLTPGADDARAIEAALQAADVELQPGRYILSRPVTLAAGRTLRGVGAVLYRAWDDVFQNHVFRPADDVTVEGITVEGDRPPVGSPASAGRSLFSLYPHTTVAAQRDGPPVYVPRYIPRRVGPPGVPGRGLRVGPVRGGAGDRAGAVPAVPVPRAVRAVVSSRVDLLGCVSDCTCGLRMGRDRPRAGVSDEPRAGRRVLANRVHGSPRPSGGQRVRGNRGGREARAAAQPRAALLLRRRRTRIPALGLPGGGKPAPRLRPGRRAGAVVGRREGREADAQRDRLGRSSRGVLVVRADGDRQRRAARSGSSAHVRLAAISSTRSPTPLRQRPSKVTAQTPRPTCSRDAHLLPCHQGGKNRKACLSARAAPR